VQISAEAKAGLEASRVPRRSEVVATEGPDARLLAESDLPTGSFSLPVLAQAV
jgi:hypothetical protein